MTKEPILLVGVGGHSRACIDVIKHDVIIKDHCHIATAATINSGVRIGTGIFIGSNSNVKQGVNTGDRCVIGMGQQVLANCETGVSMS